MLGGHHIPHCLNDRTKIIRFIKIASIFHFLVQNHYLRVEKSETMNNLIILAATAVPQAAEPELSLWSMIVKGGWLMIPIFILSIIAVYIFCERYMLLRKYTRISDTFPDKIRDCIFAGNIRGAVTVCNEENTPMSRMLVKGLLHYRLPVTELRAIVESAANLEVAGMEKGLSTLATCAGMAPMIGFLGTVVGNGTSLLRYGYGWKQYQYYPVVQRYLYGDDYYSRRFNRRHYSLFCLQCPYSQNRSYCH